MRKMEQKVAPRFGSSKEVLLSYVQQAKRHAWYIEGYFEGKEKEGQTWKVRAATEASYLAGILKLIEEAIG